MGCSRKTGNEASPGRARVCEAERKDNICEYVVTYDDDFVRSKHRINQPSRVRSTTSPACLPAIDEGDLSSRLTDVPD